MLPENQLTIFRLANVYGSPKNKGIIGHAIERIFEPERAPLKIYSGGRQTRDFILLDDAVAAMIAVKEKSSESDIVNIATGESIALLDAINCVEEISGGSIPHEVLEEERLEIQQISLSNVRLSEKYSYNKFHTFQQGITIALERYREARPEYSSEIALRYK